MSHDSENRSDFKEKLKVCVAGKLLFDEPLSRHTSWRVGGPGEILFVPDSTEDLRTALVLAKAWRVPVTVLGNGSNVLVSDRGISGLTVKLSELDRAEVLGNQIIAGAGAVLPKLSRLACENGLSGLEFAAGIPATLGGAIAGNAGAHGSCMADIIVSVTAMDYEGQTKIFAGEELAFGYRTSLFKEGGLIVTEARMLLTPKPGEEIRRQMDHFLAVRRETQPVGSPTAGSVFVNPVEAPAGHLIEKAGLKGEREGGAQVSEKHANFIVNVDRATADDIMRLIKRIQETVFKESGIRLKTEIEFLG